MAEILIEATRGGMVESIHRGDIAVVGADGALLYSVGDPYRQVILRSAAKPLQALYVVLSGAADKFAMTDAEIAILCGSHYGEENHVRVIHGLLDKMGLGLDDLLCGIAPMRPDLAYTGDISDTGDRAESADAAGAAGVADTAGLPSRWTQAHTDCSGKHCGFLAACLAQGFPTAAYDNPAHPVQQQTLQVVATMCRIEAGDIRIAEDGCGVPVFAMPLYHLALGFARLANPAALPAAYRDACARIVQGMGAAPEMLAGTGGFCTALVEHTHGRLVGKMGAEGVYGLGALGKEMGIGVKIDDGNYERACPPVVMAILRQLGLISQREGETLAPFAPPIPIRNNHGRQVGETRAVFTLCG